MPQKLNLSTLSGQADQLSSFAAVSEFQKQHLEDMQRIASARQYFENIVGESTAIQRQLEALQAPSLMLQKQFEELMSPALRLREQIEKINKPFSGIQEQIKALSRPFENLATRYSDSVGAELKRLTEVSNQHSAHFREMADFVNSRHIEMLRVVNASDQARLMAQFAEPVMSVRTWMTEHSSYTESIRQQIAAITASAGLSPAWSIAGEGLSVENGGNPTAELAELSDALGGTRTLAESAEVLLHYASGPASKISAIALNLLWLILLGWFINQLPSAVELEEKFGLTHREAVKAARASPPLDLSQDQREALRFVSAPSLSAHTSPKQKSKVLARLPFGTHVVVDNRVGDWVHAIFRDPLTGEESEGWLLARYVTKFDKY